MDPQPKPSQPPESLSNPAPLAPSEPSAQERRAPVSTQRTALSPNLSQTPQSTPVITPLPSNQSSIPPVPTQQQLAPDIMKQAAAHDHKRGFIHAFKSLLSFVSFIVTVVVAAMLINHFVFQSYYVDGLSMTPTLENEDRLIINKVGKTIATIQGKPYLPARGDIVILDSTILDQYGHEEQLIKRVIGLPGETVIIRDGMVMIKNHAYPDGFNVDKTLGLQLEPTYSEAPIEVTVPEDMVYVLGDNRGLNGSFDSRAFGATSSSNIQGNLAARIFPFDRAQAF